MCKKYLIILFFLSLVTFVGEDLSATPTDDFALHEVFIGKVEAKNSNGKIIYSILTKDNDAPGRLYIGDESVIQDKDCLDSLKFALQKNLFLFVDSEFTTDSSGNYIATMDTMHCRARDADGLTVDVPTSQVSSASVAASSAQKGQTAVFTGTVTSAFINGYRTYTMITRDNGAPGKLVLGALENPMPDMIKMLIAEAGTNNRPITLRADYAVDSTGVYYVTNPKGLERTKPDVFAPEGLLKQQEELQRQGRLVEVEDYITNVKNSFTNDYEPKHYLKIRSLMNNFTVTKVTVNQGNRIYQPVADVFPITINYGESITLVDDVMALAAKNFEKQDLSGKNKMEQNYEALLAIARTEEVAKICEIQISLNTGLVITFQPR